MLRLVRASDPRVLADALADLLRAPAPGADPLDPEWVVVGARPTERWLRVRLAERLQVCAHVHFPSPSSLVEAVVAATLGGTEEAARAWTAPRLTWRILAALPTLLDDAAFAPLRRYLVGADGTVEPGSARAVAFARRVAGCFERYGRVLPDVVRAWAHPDDATGVARAEDRWQPVLWRALLADPLAGRPLPALVDDAVAALRRDGAPAALPRRLAWLVQPGHVAPLHARVLAELARAGVAVHVLAPSLVPWPDDAADDAPALRVSLGRLAGDAARVLAAACAAAGVTPQVATAEVATPEVATARAAETAPTDTALADPALADTALARLQQDLRTGTLRGPGGAAPHALAVDDASIRVHACHGPMRQAEVLRDALLAHLAADPTLAPRDVLVLTPDVATFAPLLEAAFGVTAGAAALPVRVLDRPARRANPAADVLLRVLALAAGRVTAVEVLDLVLLPAVASRFRLGADAEESLRRWVRESGVRWGLDADDRTAPHGLPGDEEHTWRFGLERLLLGWGLPGDGARLFGGALPYDEIEGSDAERLGDFAEACRRLFDAVRAVRGARPLAAWRRVLGDVVHALVDDRDRALAVPRRELQRALDALVTRAGAPDARLGADGAPPPGFDAPVTLEAVRHLLDAEFAEAPPTGGAAGAITVAALRGGRALPARVVALVGMDEGRVPRPRGGDGFDLLARAGVPGAADAAAEDRWCVLEAILAAEERLVVTYTGRTVDTNEAVAPAVPVGELLDALDAAFVRADAEKDPSTGEPLPARTLVERAHPLQPFSARAFDGGAGEDVRSHDVVQLAGARAARAPRVAAPPFVAHPLPRPDLPGIADGAPREVTIDALAEFLARPARTLVARRLGVWIDEPEALDPCDPLEPDGREQWTLRQLVLERLLADEDPTPARELLRAGGALPHGTLGALAFERAVAEAREVLRPARSLRGAIAHDAVDVDAVMGAWRLVGRVGPVWAAHADVAMGLREVQAGKLRARHLAALWVRHLALHLAFPTRDLTSAAITRRADRTGHNVVQLGTVAEPAVVLHDLLELYGRAEREPIPYAPETALAYVEAFVSERTPEDAERDGRGAAERTWADDRGAREGQDAYAVRLHGEAGIVDQPGFGDIAKLVWTRALGVRKQVSA